MFKIRFNKKIAFSNNSKALPLGPTFNGRGRPILSGLKGIGRPTLLGNLRFSVLKDALRTEDRRRGIVLLIVLGTLLVVVSLATVILSLILSHSRLTYHQTSRIQAYYAALAGMNLARENLRNGTWTTGSYTLCNSGCTVNDSDIPYRAAINIEAPGTSIDGVGRKITITTTYTYTP